MSIYITAAIVCESIVSIAYATKVLYQNVDHGALQKWIRVLAAELGERMSADESEYERKAKTLAVHYRYDPNTLFSLKAARASYDSVSSVPYTNT